MLQPILNKCCCSRSLTPRMNISTTVHLYGGVKVKRRKQEMRVDNPHLPTVNRDNRPTVIVRFYTCFKHYMPFGKTYTL